MEKTSFFQKFATCFIAGLTLVAIILVLGRSIPEKWVIPELVFGLAGLCLITSLIYPFIWQRKERQQTTDSAVIMSFWQGIIRYGLAFDIAHFGFKKIFGQQFIVPYSMYDDKIGTISGEWLTWHYFGFSYSFGFIVAIIQIGGSILLLFPKTRLLGVMLLLPVLLNILLINMFYELNAGATLQSIILSLGLVYLLLLDYNRLVTFFFQSKETLQKAVFSNPILKNSVRFLMIFIPFILTFPTYYVELMPPNIRGIYEVTGMTKYQKDAPSKGISIDSALTRIYFDRYGDCTFVYKNDRKQRGEYVYNDAKKELSVVFTNENHQNDTLTANIRQEINPNQTKVLGLFGKEMVEMQLVKLR